MANKIDKVIVTSLARLRAKYSQRGLMAIRGALAALRRADARRGLGTTIVSVDDVSQMRALGARPATNPLDVKQAKAAIDGIYRALTPDYIMILGAHDVIPHQDISNPLFRGRTGDDPDKFAWGDLPYACDAPYSNSVNDFVGPTRVVGRLPDVTGSNDHNYLVALLRTAAGYRPVDRATASSYFAVGAQVWERSSSRTLHAIFGNEENFQRVPPRNDRWPVNLIRARIHFFNCHGASHSSKFYGQPISRPAAYPDAVAASYMAPRLREGTIVAAECCYGGQLYALSPIQQHLGMCNTYLRAGSYGFFASTTIAYGPARSNGQADLICRYFIQSVLEGASIGRAALQARQKFAGHPCALDPSDLKTLAQFNLYGDPALTPVQFEPITRPLSRTGSIANRRDRHARRRALTLAGNTLHETVPRLRRTKGRVPPAVLRTLREHSRRPDLKSDDVQSFKVKHRDRLRSLSKMLRKTEMTSAFHIVLKSVRRRIRPAQETILDIVGYVVEEVDGMPVSVKQIRSR
jgi:hypothetical protein